MSTRSSSALKVTAVGECCCLSLLHVIIVVSDQMFSCISSQGCSLGLECLGLEAVSRRFWNVSVSSRSREFGKNRKSRSCLGLEDIMSRSRLLAFVTFVLVNINAMHQPCGYIRKKIMYLTHKKQVVKWQTSPVSVFKLQHCSLETFLERLVSSRSWEFEKMQRLG